MRQNFNNNNQTIEHTFLQSTTSIQSLLIVPQIEEKCVIIHYSVGLTIAGFLPDNALEADLSSWFTWSKILRLCHSRYTSPVVLRLCIFCSDRFRFDLKNKLRKVRSFVPKKEPIL